MLLLSFSSGCVLTLAPDLSEWVGLKNKDCFSPAIPLPHWLIRVVAGKSSDKYGRVPVLIVSSVALALSMIFLSASHSIVMFMTAAAVFGLSWGINGPAIAAWTVDLCRPDNRGRAVATMYIALEAGIGLGALSSAMIYQNHSSRFVYAFIAPAVLAVIAAFC